MQEYEVKPGVFISVVTREKWLQRVDVLKGEDLHDFISKCNLFRMYPESDLILKGDLLEACRSLEPNFDTEKDYYVIRMSHEAFQRRKQHRVR